ncbi:MAG: hypothetical protein KGH64_02775, partial [Candidatus Micrarchaeota archaeon]|nr:hypothetical protein [Candidatus Micrarchaeota archaeon]
IQFTTLLPSDVGRLSKTELQNLEGSILVDYNGAVSISMARYLKKEHGIDAFVLDGGLLYVKRKAPTTPAVVKSMEKDVAQITQTTSWTARNAPSIGRVAEILFGCAWLADALVKINSNFYTQVTSIINAGASGEPTFMHLWVGFWAGLSAINPALFASIVIILEMILGIFLITGFMRKQIYRIGFVYSLLLWSVPEGLGGPYNNPAIVPTDIGTGIIYAFVFVFVAIINSIYGSNKYTIDNFLERHVAGWERIAEIKY